MGDCDVSLQDDFCNSEFATGEDGESSTKMGAYDRYQWGFNSNAYKWPC